MRVARVTRFHIKPSVTGAVDFFYRKLLEGLFLFLVFFPTTATLQLGQPMKLSL